MNFLRQKASNPDACLAMSIGNTDDQQGPLAMPQDAANDQIAAVSANSIYGVLSRIGSRHSCTTSARTQQNLFLLSSCGTIEAGRFGETRIPSSDRTS